MGYLLSLGFEKVLLLYTPKNSALSDIIDTFVYRIGLVQSNYSYSTAVGLFGGIVGVILVVSANKISKALTGESLY
jgi:putative aldouronate transport system permease protein